MKRVKGAAKDSLHEGRDEYFIDVDRMISEGLAGGTLHSDEALKQIDQTHDFEKEEPPHHSS